MHMTLQTEFYKIHVVQFILGSCSADVNSNILIKNISAVRCGFNLVINITTMNDFRNS